MSLPIPEEAPVTRTILSSWVGFVVVVVVVVVVAVVTILSTFVLKL